jgi:hypothetical protein
MNQFTATRIDSGVGHAPMLILKAGEYLRHDDMIEIKLGQYVSKMVPSEMRGDMVIDDTTDPLVRHQSAETQIYFDPDYDWEVIIRRKRTRNKIKTNKDVKKALDDLDKAIKRLKTI